MNWQQLKYGTVVAVGLATTGTLWYVRSDHTVYTRDMIEIWQGANERYWATWTPFSENLTTNCTTNITWTPSTLEYISETTTNGPTFTNYLLRATNVVQTTNLSGANSRPLSLSYAKEQAGYYAFGGYTQYVASGFSADYNQTYNFYKRDYADVEKYTWMQPGRLVVMDVFTNANTSPALILLGPEFLGEDKNYEEYSRYCAMLVENITSLYSAVEYAVYQTNAYYMSPWEYDGGGVVSGASVIGSGSIVTSMIWRGQAIDGADDYTEHEFYLRNEITQMNDSEICSDVANAINNMLDELQYTDTESKTGTLYEIADTNMTTTKLSSSNAFNRAGLTNGVFTSVNPRYVLQRDLTERNDILSQMTDAESAASEIALGSNIWLGEVTYPNVLLTDWADAKTAAENDLHLTNTATRYYAGAWTEGAVEYGYYSARIVVYPWNHIDRYVDTGSVCDIDFYVHVWSVDDITNLYGARSLRRTSAAPGDEYYNAPALLDTTELSNDMVAAYWTTNIYYYSEPDSQSTNIILTGLDYTNAPALPWCEDPAVYAISPTTEVSTCRGFSIHEGGDVQNDPEVHQLIIHRWQFEHCPEMIYTP